MQIEIALVFHIVFSISISRGSADEDIFTDYCQADLCQLVGGVHSGCKDGVLHNGKFQSPPCTDLAAIIPLTDSDKQAVLDFHNTQRNYVACGGLYKHYGLRPACRLAAMSWDKELEKTAFLHSSYCIFEHDKCRSTVKYPLSGQNLGILGYKDVLRNSTVYINIITYLWYLEYTVTKMDMIDSYYHQTQWMVGHFLTSINERNNRVGCSLINYYDTKRKSTLVMLSCNYPTTNIGGSTIYNSCKNPGSKCTSGTDPKYKYLCSMQEEYDVSSMLEFEKYDGTGNENFDCGRIPEFYHYGRDDPDFLKNQHKALYPKIPIPTDEYGGGGGGEGGEEEEEVEEAILQNQVQGYLKATQQQVAFQTIQRINMIPMIVPLFFGKNSHIKM